MTEDRGADDHLRQYVDTNLALADDAPTEWPYSVVANALFLGRALGATEFATGARVVSDDLARPLRDGVTARLSGLGVVTETERVTVSSFAAPAATDEPAGLVDVVPLARRVTVGSAEVVLLAAELWSDQLAVTYVVLDGDHPVALEWRARHLPGDAAAVDLGAFEVRRRFGLFGRRSFRCGPPDDMASVEVTVTDGTAGAGVTLHRSGTGWTATRTGEGG